MISHLRGTVAAAGPTWVVVDVGGVGIRASCPPATAAAARVGEEIHLDTSLVVREDSLSLFGFATTADRDAFDIVLGAVGVGPKLALAILSVLDAARLKEVLQSEDVSALCTVPGIGKKTAAKLMVELKDKAVHLEGGPSATTAPSSTDTSWRQQLMEGLEGLGWSTHDAEQAVETVAPLKDDDPRASLGVLMRAALRSLAR